MCKYNAIFRFCCFYRPYSSIIVSYRFRDVCFVFPCQFGCKFASFSYFICSIRCCKVRFSSSTIYCAAVLILYWTIVLEMYCTIVLLMYCTQVLIMYYTHVVVICCISILIMCCAAVYLVIAPLDGTMFLQFVCCPLLWVAWFLLATLLVHLCLLLYLLSCWSQYETSATIGTDLSLLLLHSWTFTYMYP